VILEKEFPAVKDNLNNSLLPATPSNSAIRNRGKKLI
jgi:hypothetical protein